MGEGDVRHTDQAAIMIQKRQRGMSTRKALMSVQEACKVPGVKTRECAWALLSTAINERCPVKFFPCTSSEDCVAALQEARTSRTPVAIQFSCGDSHEFAGEGLENDQFQAAQLGAVSGAFLVRHLAPAYGATVLLHVNCQEAELPWLSGLLELDECFLAEKGEPMFSSFSVQLPSWKIKEYKTFFDKIKSRGSPLQVSLVDDADPSVLLPLSDRLFAPTAYAPSESVAKVAVFSAKSYDIEWLRNANKSQGRPAKLFFHDLLLSEKTVHLATGCFAVCAFVNDDVNEAVVKAMKKKGVKLIALRCAGFNNVDLDQVRDSRLKVCRVPAYSPDAVSEHAVALMCSLNRKIPQAWRKTQSGNFTLDGQLGFDMLGKRVGIVGTGKIGSITARILKRGFGCEVVGYDKFKNPYIMNEEPEGLGIPYVELDELFATCDIISLHAPLLPATRHMINAEAISKMKKGVIIVNTSRGGLIDTMALLEGLKSHRVSAAGLDVYEDEGDYFFEDCSHEMIEDDILARLLTFPNVTLTAHQAFFTKEALNEISNTTLRNIVGVYESGTPPKQFGKLDTEVELPRKREGSKFMSPMNNSTMSLKSTLKKAPANVIEMGRTDSVEDLVGHRGSTWFEDKVIFPANIPGTPSRKKAFVKAQGGCLLPLRVAVFSCKQYDRDSLVSMDRSLGTGIEFMCHDVQLSAETASLAQGCYAVVVFVNDEVDEECIEALHGFNVKLIALRCAGFNNVHLDKAEELGIGVCRVPAYSPYAVAEHAITLMTSLNRRIPQAWAKTRSGNFSLEGQLGFDMTGKKVGVIGTGKIGQIAATILKRGYECDVIAYDVFKSPVIEEMGIKYVELDEIFRTSDVITIHAPLMPATHHMVNREAVEKMKPGVVIINCSRGGLIDTQAMLWGLKQKIIGGAGLDVFEEEADYFFNDLSNSFVHHDDFARLLSLPNVIITAHQAFFTKEALAEIAKTTLNNIAGFFKDGVTPKQTPGGKGPGMETMVKPQK
eukprot:CAMPEP_0115591034 /NCGR_PEP_ID=MMETSP0272-20121206/10069_1 /TAXON_ID=71861 /ORGANISM="Scrippsiella trochoidea, Strain CCMP3099" /LENGTH=1001 /DNA_ID=CAMNT_0003026243 /DNA_START=342 /DNA_END=3347 /DNA_ORIENTATION=+